MLLSQAYRLTANSLLLITRLSRQGKIAIACSGYRVTARAGHHAITFEAAHLSLGPNASTLTDYFDACRRKRNVIDYDNSSVATETEAAELVRKAGVNSMRS